MHHPEQSPDIGDSFVPNVNEYFEESRTILIDEEASFQRHLSSQSFDDLELLCRTVEDLIVREEQAEVERISASAGAHPVFWEESHPYWWDDIIAPKFREAFLVALMAAVELHLRRVAECAGVVMRASAFDERDGRGGFYSKVRRYLRNSCGIVTPADRDWDRILGFYATRIAIAHRGGFVGDDKDQLEAFARMEPTLFVDSDSVEIGRDFCEAALKACSDYLEQHWEQVALLCRARRAAGD